MAGLLCTFCGWANTSVKDTDHYGDITKRRRECARCGLRFNTIEQWVADVRPGRKHAQDGKGRAI